jgi:hypothetical protein
VTKEKIYIVGGPEFESIEGHLLVIDCALHRLRCYPISVRKFVPDLSIFQISNLIGATQCMEMYMS